MNLTNLVKFWPLRKLLIVLWTLLGVVISYYCAYLLRFDDQFARHIRSFEKSLPLLVGIVALVFLSMRQFSGLWRYYSIHDLGRTVLACTIAIGLFSLVTKGGWVKIDYSMSRSILMMEFILLTGWCTGSRAFIRFLREKRRQLLLGRKEFISRVLICGEAEEFKVTLSL